MRITFDRDKCQGHGRCYALAPDLFDTDDEGYAVLLVDAPDGQLTSEQEAAATLAADNCPEYAITVHP
jgi:ferredoxin